MNNYTEMGDQINANKMFHSSATYIQNMKITRSFCKKLLMIKCQFFFTLVLLCMKLCNFLSQLCYFTDLFQRPLTQTTESLKWLLYFTPVFIHGIINSNIRFTPLYLLQYPFILLFTQSCTCTAWQEHQNLILTNFRSLEFLNDACK